MTRAQNLNAKDAQDAYNREAANVPLFAGKISELCKYVWAGSLAIFYALVTTSSNGAANTFAGNQRSLLFIAAIAGSLAFLFDYLQNLSAYLHARLLKYWMETTSPISHDEYNRRTRSIFTRANAAFFFAKNVAVLVTASLIAYVIATGFLK